MLNYTDVPDGEFTVIIRRKGRVLIGISRLEIAAKEYMSGREYKCAVFTENVVEEVTTALYVYSKSIFRLSIVMCLMLPHTQHHTISAT